MRVLIPARVGDADVPWRQVLADYRREIPLDGYTSWCEVTELPGDGSFVLDRAYHPAAGILSKHFCTRLLHALPPRIRDQRWHAERHDVLSAAGAVSRHHLLPPMSS